jgi:sugar phosphate isomerase/epimerase
MVGYDGYVSLEMEDLTMSIEAGVLTSINALQQTISQ